MAVLTRIVAHTRPLAVILLARLKHALGALPQHCSPQLVVLAQGGHTITTFMITAFHENWTIRFALSPDAAMALLRKAPSAALVCDWDSHAANWRGLCGVCVQCNVPFYLAATNPSDDLFLAVAAAGGSGVLWKPVSAERIVAAMDSARSLAGSDNLQPVDSPLR